MIIKNVNYRDRFENYVWPRVVNFLENYSQATFMTWIGPYMWNEDGDLKRIITRFSEDEFGLLTVHNETKIAKFYSNIFKDQVESGKREKHRTYSVDINITDARDCKNMDDLRDLQHELFIEVKGIANTMWSIDVKRKIEGFREDCEKLKQMIDNMFCKYAIAILVDNGDHQGNNHVKDKSSFIKELENEFFPVVPLIWQK